MVNLFEAHEPLPHADSVLPDEFNSAHWASSSDVRKRVPLGLYITFSWPPSLPPRFSLRISHPVSLLGLRLLMSYSGLAPGIGAPEQRQSHSEVISEEGETVNQIRSDVSCLHWYGASIEVASGIFLANGHLSKALTSGAQALLLNHSLSGSCPSAQVWAPAGGTLSTGFRAIWEQG